MTIYKNRYQAKKVSLAHEVIVKVDGGYIIMSYEEYRYWKNNK